MKVIRKNTVFCTFYFVIFLVAVFLIDKYGYFETYIEYSSNAFKDSYCPIPVYNDGIHDLKDIGSFQNLKCPNYSDLVFINNGRVIISENQYCSYQCIFWKTDFEYQLSVKASLSNLSKVPCEYLFVNCQLNKTGSEKGQFIISGIRNETLISDSMSVLSGLKKPRDVLILAIDSISYNAYKRFLPKIYSILHDQLDGVSFRKFNTMGDGTTVNVQGMLTGTKDTETYETRRRIAGAKPVDNYNWIWKHYKKHGYLTQYYEEMTEYGTFQYRLLGFENQPTDIYLRTALMYAERNNISIHFCLGNKRQHSEILRFYNEVVRENFEAPKFSFVFFSYASHDDNKYVQFLDEDIAQFLIDTRKNNPETLIVLYSDHGHRFNSRQSMQGKYEERLPFLGISLPKDLQHLKPILIDNSQILISGLDVHATLEDILGIYKPKIRNRHMSLLRQLPADRSCADIESAAHWCACLKWKPVNEPNSVQLFLKIADIVAKQISKFTSHERDLCVELRLDRILSLHKMVASSDVLKFKKSADVDGFVPDLSDKTVQSHIWYKMSLKTKPGDAVFDITVTVKSNDLNDKQSEIVLEQLRPDDVSRINSYAPWVKCLTDLSNRPSLVSDIRKFCICKNAL